MSTSRKLFIVSILCAAIASCHPSPRATNASKPSTLHTIILPRFQPNLPDGPGREAFASSCLSCHSTRYISIQPPLTAAKWEESVKKMIKTYAAPIAEDQIPLIVQYLMATKETDPNAWSAMTPVLMASFAQTIKPSNDLDRGAKVYAQNCASCHGASGAGDGATAKTMLPRPTDLTAIRFSHETLSAAVLNGVPATAMPGYANLPSEDLSAVLAFTKNFAPKATLAVAANDEAKALFAKNCIECHGKNGDGDGMTSRSLPRSPTNFYAVQPSHAAAFRAITDGVAGTAMPAWKSKLSDAQRAVLADYVRSFYSELR